MVSVHNYNELVGSHEQFQTMNVNRQLQHSKDMPTHIPQLRIYTSVTTTKNKSIPRSMSHMIIITNTYSSHGTHT